ncbi:MAG: type I pantothenate kinase [Streptococcus sp.]|nr:type I pantothenate kinase [Streptococcus sp.]
MQELTQFEQVSRQEWQSLHQNTKPLLTVYELENLKSLNDNINIQDVKEIYLPLISLIQIYKISMENLLFSKSLFLKKECLKKPFIIGISGSVAVGKSTISRLLQLLLSRTFKESSVEMVTTDGFLYPNKVLKRQNILNRKGFPESYDMELLLLFLDNMKNGITSHIPIYSHEIYDIIPDHYQTIERPDFLIIEGINVFQNQKNNHLYMTDYFDFSIYIDADENDIEQWYIERFKSLLEIAKSDPNNYYQRFLNLPQKETEAFAKEIWSSINLVNLKEFIEPTRNRADLILHKTKNHKIDKIYLKK